MKEGMLFILVALFGVSLAMRWTLNFYMRPSLRYNIEYMNVSWDFSVYDKASRDNPVNVIPEVNMIVMKDLNRMRMIFKVLDVKTNEVNIEQSINFCNLNTRSVTGLVMKPIIDSVMKSANFKLECPLVKGQHLRINAYNLSNSYLPLKPNQKRCFMLKLVEGRQLAPVMSVDFYYVKIRTD